MNVRLNKDQKIKIANTEDVYNIMQQILLRENKLRRGQEHFWIIGLNPANKISFIELMALGADNRVNIKAPPVFRMAIYKEASRVIFVHNHPSGIIIPSADDLNTTDRLLKAGQLVDIDVIDHIIISEKEYFSFNQEGLITQFKNNGIYQIVNKERAELEKWKLERNTEKATKNTNIEMAKKLLDLKVLSEEEIRKITGLTLREFNKILKEIGK